MSNLVEYAEKELRLAGLFDKTSDYNGMLGESVLELIRVFAAQEHSGFSAGLTLQAFDLVARFKPMTPVTSDPEEWMEVGKQEDGFVWQNRRNGSFFSEDGGKSYYDIDAGDNRAVKKSNTPKAQP